MGDLVDELRALAGRIEKQKAHIQTEEATKTAFILPFIQILGYNVFDPTEVTPELCADVGIKRGEKVDYAILGEGGKPLILFECKGWQTNLDAVHASQLFRYFSVTPAKIGIVTNGIVYRFFSDLEEPNKMDAKPFLEIDLLNLNEALVPELKLLRKSTFNLDELLSAAGELKWMRELKRVFGEEVANPSEDLARLFAARVNAGRMTKAAIEQFQGLTKRAIAQFISDRVSDRLRSALDQETGKAAPQAAAVPPEPAVIIADVTTTPEELEAFHIIRAILAEVVDPNRVTMRDAKSYCAILLDDNNRRPLCRLYFDRGTWQVGLFDADKNEERVPLHSTRELYRHAGRLRAQVAVYDPAAKQGGEVVSFPAPAQG